MKLAKLLLLAAPFVLSACTITPVVYEPAFEPAEPQVFTPYGYREPVPVVFVERRPDVHYLQPPRQRVPRDGTVHFYGPERLRGR
ncbi:MULTISPECIES: hypothetical protein [unclassified Variovorax]|uniref:hypothetical protein n=1 Tax=unclassified Variovorax TaxID=663243 RepID=UPI00131946EE|nr:MULTISPECIES: hypothetical protein [unclassified Variovorax]VTU42950.1 hypothetical protein H6P1_00320 [Variovorax sp. PBL-H6]VTU43563.1 hypothetical protein SRS16P1_00585 [Variovorax sp. SRS16]VTU43624.1 hypothetical protein E5P1_00579 [Variovorax sp. PBL-E5]